MKRLWLLLCLLIVFCFAVPRVSIVKASMMIHIRADGLIEPSSVPILCTDNATYVFTDNIKGFIIVERDNIRIDGRNYTLEGLGAFETVGISLLGRNNVTIKDVKIEAFWHGIEVSASMRVNMFGNAIINHYDGLCLFNSSYIQISKNKFMGNYDDAIWLEECLNINITHNTISGSDLTSHDYGITIYKSSNINVSESLVTNSEYGIGLQYSLNNTITQCNITATEQFAFWLLDSDFNDIHSNSIVNNYGGLWLAHSSNNSFHHNNFVNNSVQVYNGNSSSIWDDGFEGNYWSDYDGLDDDGDGIGDSSYIIDDQNQDRYPLADPYVIPEFSTIMMLLSMAGTLFVAMIFRRWRV